MNIIRALSALLVVVVTTATAAAQPQQEEPAAPQRADSGAAPATGPVQSLRATITGNQEQPKVLYIVPWKTAYENNAVAPKPIAGQTDKVFRHLERHEHQRHVELLQDFSASDAAQ